MRNIRKFYESNFDKDDLVNQIEDLRDQVSEELKALDYDNKAVIRGETPKQDIEDFEADVCSLSRQTGWAKALGDKEYDLACRINPWGNLPQTSSNWSKLASSWRDAEFDVTDDWIKDVEEICELAGYSKEETEDFIQRGLDAQKKAKEGMPQYFKNEANYATLREIKGFLNRALDRAKGLRF